MIPAFAMNRTCAPQLALVDFARLAAEAGVAAVEIRNDIEGREFMDGTPAAKVRRVLDEHGLKVAAVNALQRFNDWGTEREREARTLMTYAAGLGAPGVVLCPVHTPGHGWSEADAERQLRSGLKHLRPILLDLGVKGYVEPLGMAGSTMKRQDMAVAAISDVGGWDAYELCFDTFQFFRCGDDVFHAERVGLAHMSGITRADLAPEELTEPDRGLVDSVDRVNNFPKLRALLQSGFAGYISMEPFSPQVQQSPNLLQELIASFARVRTGLGLAT
jgi:2-keto-myo-inositol isomerase